MTATERPSGSTRDVTLNQVSKTAVLSRHGTPARSAQSASGAWTVSPPVTRGPVTAAHSVAAPDHCVI